MPDARHLYVLRHAKSSWDDPGLDDRERPLAPRGRRAVQVLADHLRSSGIEPEVVLCSPARRTRETLEGAAPTGEWLIEEALYGASPSALLSRLQQLPDHVASAMVIGHNPTVQVLVLRLAARAHVDSAADLAEVQRKFPTGALATLRFECGWSELSPGSASLTAFVRPKQLVLR